MKGLGRRLRSGIIHIHPDEEIIYIHDIDGQVFDTLPYLALEATDWGYVYERHVAQVLTGHGYDVKMSGLEKGFLDGGIDLIAQHPEEGDVYIQCKFMTKGKLSKQRIEWILYNASRYLEKTYTGNMLHFWLVIPSYQQAFVMKTSRQGRITYPVASYFLSKNKLQSRVRLHIVEVEMAR